MWNDPLAWPDMSWIYSVHKTLQAVMTPLGISNQPYHLAQVNDKLSCAKLRAAFTKMFISRDPIEIQRNVRHFWKLDNKCDLGLLGSILLPQLNFRRQLSIFNILRCGIFSLVTQTVGTYVVFPSLYLKKNLVACCCWVGFWQNIKMKTTSQKNEYNLTHKIKTTSHKKDNLS